MSRILLIAERFPPDIGGLARSGARTAETLARIGARVDVLAFTRTLAPGALETSESGGATLHRFGLFANLDLSLQHALNVVDWLHAKRAFDVVWGHYLFPAGFVAVMIAELHGLRSTVSARGNDVDRMMFPPGDFARLRWTLERADLVSAVSAELSRKIDVLVGREGGVMQIPNAVDSDVFSADGEDAGVRERYGIARNEAVMGFCGELRHKKGFPFLLDALVEVRATRPACLFVIGEVRAHALPHLQAFAAEHPEAAERIVVTERIDDPNELAACYRACDVYLQPSVWDGLPNALLEAMACEVVVIASDAGAMREVITTGEDGFLLPRHDLHKLGEAVIELLDVDNAERERIGRAGRERLKSAYSPAHEEEALRQLLAHISSA